MRMYYYYYYHYYYLIVLVFELRPLCLLGRHSTTLNHIFSPFCSSYFGDSILLHAQANLDHVLLFDASSHSWDDRWVPVHATIGWDGGLMNFLFGLPSNHNHPNFSLQIVMITSISHRLLVQQYYILKVVSGMYLRGKSFSTFLVNKWHYNDVLLTNF
jgi:hypothetical protein